MSAPPFGILHRRGFPACAPAALFAFGLVASFAPAPAAAQAPKLEAAYVVLGPQGAMARAVLKDASACPAISIDGTSRAMNVRALPDSAPDGPFPVLVCELPIPAGASAASVEGAALPLPKAALRSIAAFGDTGCRLKAASAPAEPDDDQEKGKFQSCNRPSQWPFARLARSLAAQKPDLVIHVGDYVYRESACPPHDKGCKGSPHGDDWLTWKADFFAPAAPALRAAPWIVVRGNHEICRRAGHGYFRLLDPTLAPAGKPPPCIELVRHYTVTVAGRAFIVMDTSDADDACPGNACKAAPYAADFASMRPAPGAWLVTHRPVWGVRPRNVTINATLQQALAASNGRLPGGITLALAGHIHVWEVLSFTDKRSPQFVLGAGGTMLAHKITQKLAGQTIGGATVAYGRAEHRFGFTILEPAADGASWTATVRDVGGRRRFGCTIAAGEVACR